MQTWQTFDAGAASASWNMALDEALLMTAAGRAVPVLRFYGWTEPAATFGYFQRYADIANWTGLRPLIRRPTGGGLVPHDRDWTYSLVIPPGHEWHRIPARDSYRRVHDWIRVSFERIRVRTDLAEEAVVSQPGQCFAGAEQFDLLRDGRKIAGAAQRRNRHGLLVQGSVQPPDSLRGNRREWQTAMLESARDRWNIEWSDLAEPDALFESTRRLQASKYGLAAHNEKR